MMFRISVGSGSARRPGTGFGEMKGAGDPSSTLVRSLKRDGRLVLRRAFDASGVSVGQ